MPRKANRLGVSARVLVMQRGDVRLAAADYGGRAPAIVLVHGLAGWSGEWSQTAQWLTERGRVVAVDLRGHGDSERRPADMSLQAAADDLGHVIETLELGPVVLVGQSLGGLVALRFAADHLELVRGLVLIEAGPSDGDGEAADLATQEAERALLSWPVPFRDFAQAVEFFSARFGNRWAGFTWATGLEERPDGLWPRFDAAVVTQLLRDALAQSGWDDWRGVRCPTLVVRGEHGTLAAETSRRMVEASPSTEVAELQAGHDLHVEAAAALESVLTDFLDRQHLL